MVAAKAHHKPRLEDLRAILDAALAGKFEVESVSPDALIVDQSIYPRASIDMERVAQMSEALEDGRELPPILVASDRKTVVDGAHRTFAYRQKGFETCSVVVLPVSNRLDVIALSMMANSPSKGLPLRREDVHRCIGLLFNELKGNNSAEAFQSRVKDFCGSLHNASLFFGLSYYRLQQYVQKLESPAPTKASAPARGSMPARSKLEAKEPEGPWEKPELPAGAVRDVLKAPANVDKLELGSPWDFVARGLLKVTAAFEDLYKQDEDWPGKFADALGRLTEEERTFLSMDGPALLRELAEVLSGGSE